MRGSSCRPVFLGPAFGLASSPSSKANNRLFNRCTDGPTTKRGFKSCPHDCSAATVVALSLYGRDLRGAEFEPCLTRISKTNSVVLSCSPQATRIDQGLGDLSNDVGQVKTHIARSGRRSRLSKAKSRRRRPCVRRSAFSDVHPQRSKSHHDGVAHQTSLRSQQDHDDSCGLPSTGGGSPIHFAGHDPRTTSPHRHPRIEASPRRRW